MVQTCVRGLRSSVGLDCVRSVLLAPCLLADCAVDVEGGIVITRRILDSSDSVRSGWVRRGVANAPEVSLAVGSSRREIGGVSSTVRARRSGRSNYQNELRSTFLEAHGVARRLLVGMDAVVSLVVTHFGGWLAVKSWAEVYPRRGFIDGV
jgi:hypothetical protein